MTAAPGREDSAGGSPLPGTSVREGGGYAYHDRPTGRPAPGGDRRAAGAGAPGGSDAGAGSGASTEILRVPLDLRFFLPCANGGAGEVVHLTGTFMMLTHTADDGSGGTHLKLLEVQQGVTGVGETTGDHYVSSFVNLFTFNQGSGLLPITSTQEVVYRIDGPGRATSR